jgi:hypothetical protein
MDAKALGAETKNRLMAKDGKIKENKDDAARF